MEALLLRSVAHGDDGELLEAAGELAGLLEAQVEGEGLEPGGALALGRVEVQPAELLQIGDAKEGVSDLDGVVEEGERPLPGHGGEPE